MNDPTHQNDFLGGGCFYLKSERFLVGTNLILNWNLFMCLFVPAQEIWN